MISGCSRRAARQLLCAAILCLAPAVGADTGADLARAKQALAAVQGAVKPAEVNRLGRERRSAIWSNYYGLLEHLWRMRVHHEMMTRHGADRRAEFAAAHADFARALATLRELLTPGDA